MESKKIGIVGSWEKDVVGADVSLSKFLSTGAVEVFCPASEYIDFSLGEGMPVVIEKGLFSWRGEIIGSRTGTLSDMFTPRDFAHSVGKNLVGVYTVRLSRETPVTPEIIGSEAFLA